MDYADKPNAVWKAEIAIWFSMAVHAIAALIERRFNGMDGGSFLMSITFYSILCFMPIFIGRRSNLARIAYALFTVGTILLWLGGLGGAMSMTTRMAAYAMIPVTMLALYWLFVPESNRWFRVKWIAIDRRGSSRTGADDRQSNQSASVVTDNA